MDSRPLHEFLFALLAPDGCSYLAGHYRGEEFRCLRYLEVGIKSDSMVGVRTHLVGRRMQHLGQEIEAGLRGIEAAFDLPNLVVPPEQKLYNLVVFTAKVFEEFLTIHPYANGNGHAARFIAWAILGLFGYWPKRFPIEPGPKTSDYYQGLYLHRRGDPVPLEQFLLKCILG